MATVGVDGSNLQRDSQLKLVGLHLAMNQMNYHNGCDHYDSIIHIGIRIWY